MFYYLFGPKDEFDPVRRSYAMMLRKLRNAALIAVFFIVMVIGWGIPSFQGDYYSRQRGRAATAEEKLGAVYWTPFFGTQRVATNELGRGCPIVVFMPLRRCMDLSPYENRVTSFLLPKGFFHGPEPK